MPGRPVGRPVVLPRWPRYLLPALASLIVLIVLISVAAGVWTDFLWFHSVEYTSVFGTTYGVKWALFAVTAIFMMAVVGINVRMAYRLRPPNRPVVARAAGPGGVPGGDRPAPAAGALGWSSA